MNINFFPYFGVGNLLLKFVQAFKIHPVCMYVCFIQFNTYIIYSNIRAKFIKPNNHQVHKKKFC